MQFGKEKDIVKYSIKHRFPLTIVIFLYLCLGVFLLKLDNSVIVVDRTATVTVEITEND